METKQILKISFWVLLGLTATCWLTWQYLLVGVRGDEEAVQLLESQTIDAETRLEELLNETASGSEMVLTVEELDDFWVDNIVVVAPRTPWLDNEDAREWMLKWLGDALRESSVEQSLLPSEMLSAGISIQISDPRISVNGTYAVFTLDISPRDLPILEVQDMLRAFRRLEEKGARFESLSWSLTGPLKEEEVVVVGDAEGEEETEPEITGESFFPVELDLPALLGAFVDCHPAYVTCLPVVTNFAGCSHVPERLLPVVLKNEAFDPYLVADCVPRGEEEGEGGGTYFCPTSGLFTPAERDYNVDPTVLPAVPLSPHLQLEETFGEERVDLDCASVSFVLRVYVRIPDDLISDYQTVIGQAS